MQKETLDGESAVTGLLEAESKTEPPLSNNLRPHSLMVIFGNISSSNCWRLFEKFQQMRIWQEFKITLSIPTKVVKLKLPGYVQEGKIQIHAKLKTMKEPCLHDSRCSNKWESIENMKPGKLRVETVWAKFSR